VSYRGVAEFYIALLSKTIHPLSAAPILDIKKRLLILWWELEPLIGIDKVNEVGGKIQQAIRSHKLG
jgi:hypothetical protein